jgi:hypothetical protein
MASEPITEEQQEERPRGVPALMGQIATVEDRGYIVPQTIAEAYEFSRLAVHMAPDSYKGDIKQVTLAVMASMEAGLPPLYGLRNIAIINGRPTMYGDALLALVQSKGLVADYQVREIGEAFDKADPINKWPDSHGFEVMIWRKGQVSPYRGRYTVADAKRGGMWLNTRKQPWINSPDRMLEIRARSFPLRDGFADALGGLAVREEAEDMAQPEVKAVGTAFLEDGNEADTNHPQNTDEANGTD